MGTYIDDNNDTVVVDVERCTLCLNCQLICSITYEKIFEPSRARIIVERKPDGKKSTRFTEDCTACNLCVEYCLYGGITLE